MDAVPVKTDDGDNYPIPGVRAIIGPLVDIFTQNDDKYILTK